MRHDYHLTDETRKVFKGKIDRIAEEANVTDKHLYAMLAGSVTDPFAPFEHYYAASARAGAPVCHWDNKLAAIRARYEKEMPQTSLIQCLTAKIESDADTSSKMVDALKDGFIDASEADRIQAAIDKERSTLDLIEVHLQFKRQIKAVS